MLLMCPRFLHTNWTGCACLIESMSRLPARHSQSRGVCFALGCEWALSSARVTADHLGYARIDRDTLKFRDAESGRYGNKLQGKYCSLCNTSIAVDSIRQHAAAVVFVASVALAVCTIQRMHGVHTAAGTNSDPCRLHHGRQQALC